jgi:hypothetical protein
MEALRYTETNAANDSSGRVFGLDGNLYLPVLITLVGSLAGVSLLVGLVGVSLIVGSAVFALPMFVALGWVIGLRRGKPPGYDRDFIEYLWSSGHFKRHTAQQQGLLP